MCSLSDMSGSIKEIAQDIDLIGWVDIMHGRLPKSLHTYQNTYCRLRNSRRTGTDWMKQLTTKLLNISHSQWLYRNFSLHDKIKGHLQLSHQAAILEEVAKLATTRPEDIPDESRFLLEIDLLNLDKSPVTQQEYWVAAMTAAISAGRRCARPNRRLQSRVQRLNTANMTSHQKITLRAWRRITSILNQMREDLNVTHSSWRLKRLWSGNNSITDGSNKRLWKPD